MPTVAVFGTGALGCWMAGRIAAAGSARVVVVGSWLEGRSAIARGGIHIEEPGGVITGRPEVAALHDALPPADAALVLVKSHQTASVAASAARAVRDEGRIVSMQNGLGNREALRAGGGGSRVRAAVVVVGARLMAPARVAAQPGHVVLERPAGDMAMDALGDLLRAAGIDVHLSADLEPDIWLKLAVNCAINPLTALRRVANGALLDDDEAVDTMRAAAEEVAAVAAARGLAISGAAEAALAVARRTAGNRSSMLQDVERGAPTEIDALCGAVVSEARRLGVPAPVNERLWREVTALSAGRRQA